MLNRCRIALFVVVALLGILVLVSGQARDLCSRPKTSFENMKHLHDYLECIRAQSSTRYGKRSSRPSVLGKIRPDLYGDYETIQQFYDLLQASEE